MAEYYPLLSKAVGSLPNSTPDTRRVVYERARKALIGQLRTMHPPIPDEDIERESVELDRAIERLEAELASAPGPAPIVPEPKTPAPPKPTGEAKTESIQSGGQPTKSELPKSDAKPALKPKPANGKTNGNGKSAATGDAVKPKPKPAIPAEGGAIGPAEARPTPPVRPKTAVPPFVKKADAPKPGETSVPVPSVPVPTSPVSSAAAPMPPAPPAPVEAEAPQPPAAVVPASPEPLKPPTERVKPRTDARPIAPLPPGAEQPKRRLWIIPVGVGLVVVLVGLAAWKLRDHPEQIAKTKPAETTQADSGKIAERVGGTPSEDKAAAPDSDTQKPDAASSPAAPAQAPAKQTQQANATPPAANPELPVAHRAALLVEAPNEPNKVKTFLGTVVWKLNNVPQGPNDAPGLAVEADIDLPDDKMKAVVTFEKNTDASLAASHTIKVRFMVEPGSFSGDVKQISTPQMRPEASPSGDALAGVTVPIMANSFLVGLSPGNAEAANTDLIRRQQWVDIPMLLDSGKIAKLTFEKSDSGQRDLNEAFAAWSK